MSLKLGLVGLPNVGKSTLFRALTKKQVDASNYPFCTIDPNVGVVAVPDSRLEKLSKVSESKQTLPTTIEFVDIAGLVEGAHKGEGLGNKFLSHVREVDAIVEVVRCFEDDDITHVHETIDPKRDVRIINLELIMADLDTVTKRLSSNKKKAKSGEKEAQYLQSALEKIEATLNDEKFASTCELEDDEWEQAKHLQLLTFKPILYVANVSEENAIKNSIELLPEGLPISAKIESEIAELPDNESREYLETIGLKTSGLHRLILASYELLGLITFFTSGEKETRAWTVEKGATAPQAAGCIHTDFEDGFIKAEIISCDDFVASGGESIAKEKGLMRLEGKNYVMQDGDTCLFHFSN